MSEERFMSTLQQELEYQKRKNSELLRIEELLARAEKAEAELESAQKICDHWEAKAAERQQQVNEWKEKTGQLFEQNERVRGALDAADVGKYHPVNAVKACELLTLSERVELLAQKRDNLSRIAHENLNFSGKYVRDMVEWKARAEKAEASVKALHDAVDYLERKSKLQESRLEQAWDKLRRQKDIANPVDWERVRIEAAIATMQGMWASQYNFGKPMTVFAVECADALVAELQKKEVQG